MTELEKLCENALYDEIKILEDGKSVVRDVPTGKLYFKKTLDVYNEHVYAFLRDHKNRNVAAVQAFWKDGESLVVIEELIQGRTLDEILRASEASGSETEPSGIGRAESENAGISLGIPFSERIDILSQICDGLEFLHNADPPIIHRDIKASNIMVTDDGIVKIIDYDAAKIYITGQDKDTMMIGTQGLAAPEQYGFAQSDVRTDLYALGKLIERMLPGNVDANRIAKKATEMDPKKRYTSAAQMKAQILRIREHTSALDQKFEKIPSFDPMNKSHRIRARIALAAAVVAAVLILTGTGWRFIVYPARQEEAIRAELSAIEQIKGTDEKIQTVVEKFAEEHPYSKMTAEQKQSVRDEIADTQKRCYLAGNTENADAIRDILTRYYGEETTWEAISLYGKAEAEIARKSFEEGLSALYKLREEEAVDAQRHWEAGVDHTLSAARKAMEDFRETGSVHVIANALNALEKYDTDSDSELDDIYKELLTSAAGERESQHWDKASLIYDALLDAGVGDSDELSLLKQGTLYEEAEAAFAGKEYDKSSKKYSELGDYKDAAEKYKESIYLKAVREAENGSFQAAATSFETISGYKDADERESEAKYRYCERTCEEPTSTTYAYIEELVDSSYEGAEDLQTEIYKWRASISTGLSYSFGSMQSAYIRARLSGGPPDSATTVTFRIDDLVGNDSDTWSDGKEYKSGDTAEVNYSEEESSYNLFDRSYKIWVYADDGELIGTWEGMISTEF